MIMFSAHISAQNTQKAQMFKKKKKQAIHFSECDNTQEQTFISVDSQTKTTWHGITQLLSHTLKSVMCISRALKYPFTELLRRHISARADIFPNIANASYMHREHLWLLKPVQRQQRALSQQRLSHQEVTRQL